MSSFVVISFIICDFILNANVFINIHEYKDILIDCILDHYEKEWCQALIRYQVFYFRAISS